MPVGTFGDTLHKVLVLTLQFPTGTGKSYAVERTIATLASRMEEGAPPIIFVTPQKKNIPDAKAIERLCRKEGLEPGPHDVLRLLSEQEMLAETAHEGLLEDIPKAVKDKTNVEDLFDIVRHLKGTKGYGEAIRGILPEFKRSVNALFPCKGWEERLDLIENDPKWRWLADLWPSVFTKRAKVLLMTSTKFFLPHNTLIDVPKPIAGDDWIRGSVIFMDEFDSTKGYCLEAIISNSTRGRCDLAGLVRSLWHGTNVSMLPESLLAGQDGEGNAERMGKLRGVLDDVAHKTSVDYVYKATDGVIETSGLFMYDGTRRGTSFGKDYYVRTDPSRRENVIADKMKRGDGSRRLASDVNELLGAVKYAQGVIASMVRGSSSYKTTGMGEAVQNEIVSRTYA